jgi:hypothetical protein
MRRAAALDQLCRVLQADPPPNPDWRAILEVANLAFITPRLETCLSDLVAPQEVCDFVREVAQRNRQRNLRLYGQMGEAAAALNAVGLVPMVWKGAACLARSQGSCPRMISDIDMAIPPVAIEQALRALAGAGFDVIERYEVSWDHAVAVLGRAQDPGQLDLHQRPPGPANFLCGPEFLSEGTIWEAGGGQVRAPEPHMHIYLQALHDQLHDGGYWRGGFDLRHAWDIADLIRQPEGVDWDRLDRLAPTRLTAKAVAAQLMACSLLTGAEIPRSIRRWSVWLNARRQRLQYTAPRLRAPLAALAILISAVDLVRHRRVSRVDPMDPDLPAQPDTASASLKRLHKLLTAEVGGRL